MTLLGCASILFGLLITIQADMNTTNAETNNGTARPGPATAPYALRTGRRAVLILHSENNDALRSRSKNAKITSLKYQEFDDNEELLNEVFMYNLKDVADFFDVYLGTTICYEKCKTKK